MRGSLTEKTRNLRWRGPKRTKTTVKSPNSADKRHQAHTSAPSKRLIRRSLGIVTADHPEYLNAHRLCDEKIYGQGFEIAGKIYTSKATVFEQIQPILVKAQKTKDDADLLQKWAGVVQPAFIDCVKQEGFEFVKNDQ
jgi:hypothetical protein